MEYFITLLEGIITFLSPCLLPMLPIYLLFLAGEKKSKSRSIFHAIGFVLGFSIIFILMGAFAGSIGYILRKYATIVNIVTGAIVIALGMNFLGVLKINLLNRTKKIDAGIQTINFKKSILFGMVFSIGWTPCVGTFLGSALMLASNTGSWLQGVLMLACYSIGLGIPFLLSAILIDYLTEAFDFMKRHNKTISMISGILLVLIGLMMMSGTLGYFISLFDF